MTWPAIVAVAVSRFAHDPDAFLAFVREASELGD